MVTSAREKVIDRIASSFADKGFELTDVVLRNTMDLEDTIIAALKTPSPRLLEGIPVLLRKNKVDYPKLRKLIDKYGFWNEFGYLAEFASRKIKDAKLRGLVRHCQKKIKPMVDPLGLGDYYAGINLQRREWKRWNVIGMPSYRSLSQQYGRYVRN